MCEESLVVVFCFIYRNVYMLYFMIYVVVVNFFCLKILFL